MLFVCSFCPRGKKNPLATSWRKNAQLYLVGNRSEYNFKFIAPRNNFALLRYTTGILFCLFLLLPLSSEQSPRSHCVVEKCYVFVCLSVKTVWASGEKIFVSLWLHWKRGRGRRRKKKKRRYTHRQFPNFLYSLTDCSSFPHIAVRNEIPDWRKKKKRRFLGKWRMFFRERRNEREYRKSLPALIFFALLTLTAWCMGKRRCWEKKARWFSPAYDRKGEKRLWLGHWFSLPFRSLGNISSKRNHVSCVFFTKKLFVASSDTESNWSASERERSHARILPKPRNGFLKRKTANDLRKLSFSKEVYSTERSHFLTF